MTAGGRIACTGQESPFNGAAASLTLIFCRWQLAPRGTTYPFLDVGVWQIDRFHASQFLLCYLSGGGGNAFPNSGGLPHLPAPTGD